MTPPTVAGLDLSLTGTGIAVIEPDGSVDLQRLASAGAKDASLMDRHERLCRIRNTVIPLVRDAAVVVIEGPAYGVPAQRGRHDLSGLWWLVVSALHHTGTPVAIVTPKQRAKFATDNGNASKIDVRSAARRMWPVVDVHSFDEADALILASTAAVRYGLPVQFTVLERHRLCLSATQWPDQPRREAS